MPAQVLTSLAAHAAALGDSYVLSRGRIAHQEQIHRLVVLEYAMQLGRLEAEFRARWWLLRQMERLMNAEVQARLKLAGDALVSVLQIVSTARIKIVVA
jgi:hypothetical protein